MYSKSAKVKSVGSVKNGRLGLVFHGVYLAGNLGVWCYGAGLVVGGRRTDPRVAAGLRLSPFYFTNWNHSFQILFLSLSLLFDLLEWGDRGGAGLGRRVRRWRDIVFCGMVVPFTVFVTHMFWTVYAIDRELVFPKVFDEVVPWWFNHCVHTNTGVMVVLETLLQARPYPTSRAIEHFLYWSIAVGYAVVFYTIYFTADLWLYAVFGVMTWWQVCLYQLYIWLSSYLVYRLQFPINRLIHGTPEPEPPQKTLSNDVNHVTSEDDKGKEGEGTWSLKFRSYKPGVEGTRL